jgi:hypothetical protein
MFRKLFIDHPQSVGETYFEHQAAALSYAGPLLVAGLAATVHAIIPGLCQKTGSKTIIRLHQRLTGGHGRGAATEGEYMI